MSVEFFYLKEERSPEEIAEEMKYAFGPSEGGDGREQLMLSREPLMIIVDEAKEHNIPDEVREAMERLAAKMQNNLITRVVPDSMAQS